MTLKIPTSEDQMDLFREAGDSEFPSSADSQPSALQARAFILRPAGWWLVYPECHPEMGIQIESSSARKAKQRACRNFLNRYPEESLQVRQLEVEYGGYSLAYQDDEVGNPGI